MVWAAEENTIQFNHYTENDGLSHNSVRHILQDDNGLLWIGTFGGLNSFDGYNFTQYLSSSSNSNKINNDDITALKFHKPTLTIWIGTRNGLSSYKLDTHVFTTYLPQKNDITSIPEGEVRSICIDRFNQVWVGTKNKGVAIFNTETKDFKQLYVKDLSYVKVIKEDTKGNIWLGSYGDKGLIKIGLNNRGNISTIKEYNLKSVVNEEVNPYINFIYEDEIEGLVIGTREGLYKYNYNNDIFNSINLSKDYITNLGTHFNSIAKSDEGKYWLGTLGGIISCDRLSDISKGNFLWCYSDISDNLSLSDNLVSALFFDKTGALWIGTEDGLDKYDPYDNQFTTLKGISSLIKNKAPRISGFAKTNDGKLIVATHNNGLFLKESNGFRVWYNDHTDIASIYTINGNIFYCGLWSGKVIKLNYLTEKVKEIDLGFKDVAVKAFCNMGKNELLIGSFGQGAKKINKKKSLVGSSIDSLNNNIEINKIITNSHGKIWIATETGVKFFNPETNEIITYRSQNKDSIGLSHDNVSDIFIDRKGKVWAATRVGLNFFDPLIGDFVQDKTNKVLTDNWITNIVEDDEGYLWLNLNNNQIAKYNSSNDEVRVYHVNTGHTLDVFSMSDFFYSKKEGNLYLGGKEGVIVFSPKNLKDNSKSLKPFITKFRVQNRDVEVGQNVNGQVLLKQDINLQDKVELSFANRNFAFSFSTPSYVREKGNKFMYRLDGFEDNWNFVDYNGRNVQYTNLKSGDYTFKLKACNSHGYWSEEANFQIKIDPPIWLTVYAFVIYTIFILLVIMVIRKVVKRQLTLQHELTLEKVKRDKDEKLNRDKLRFFTNISHELRTPLTLILGPVKQLIETERDTKTLASYQLIFKNASRLLNLVNQLLDFRKAQEGNLKLKVTETDIIQHTLNTFTSFKTMALEKGVSFNFNTPDERLTGWVDRDKYDKILYNLLSNALKFTQRAGGVDLNLKCLTEGGRSVEIDVVDDGEGISPEDQKKIFGRFFQAKSTLQENTGTGIGLSLVKSLVEVHRGKVWFKSIKGQGSVFSFSIPIDKEDYKSEEIFDIAESVNDNKALTNNSTLNSQSKLETREKLLVIEDNEELRSFIKDYLSQSYEVHEAENGKEGLEKCLLVKPMVCVVDIMMPVMDGLDFCSQLKNNEEISHIPVLLLTALAEDENKIKGYKAGADGYLEKPFAPEVLKARIDSIITNRKELKKRFSSDTGNDIIYVTHSPADETFMTKLKDLVEENMAEPDYSVKEMCNHMNMSTSKLYRKIKEITDLSPNEFLRAMRLKKASELLKTQSYNVSEVAAMVGFNDPLYFSRCFKKQFDVSPSQFGK